MNSPLPPKLYISYHPLVLQDYLKLRDSTLEEISYTLVEQLSTGSIRGQRLNNHSEIGDLSSCFKLYFDLTSEMSPRYRIVYTYKPSAHNPEELVVLAIGMRKGFEVYKEALTRLREIN
jgi:hypothetical protein